MKFVRITGIHQLDFQINRVLTYGELAGNKDEIVERMSHVKDIEQWGVAWLNMGISYENEKRYMHSAYAYRMAEFFLKPGDKNKDYFYEKAIENFYKAFDELGYDYEIHEISYQSSSMHSIALKAKDEKGVLLVCGGYDSFVEEFVLAVFDLVNEGYTVVLFEGDGQGKTLKNNIKFIHNWEKPTKCVIDYYNIMA